MWLYNIAIAMYSLFVRVGSLWIPKAKLWCDGRRGIFERMASAISPNDRIVWIHVASLGEFEQGRPLIEQIREEHPEYKILLTFYSPSGYELRKDYKGVDYIFYLPADSPRKAKRFLEIAHPEIAIFVKYEFWLNILFQLRSLKIRSYIVSSIFRQNSIFFKWYGYLWRKALLSFDTLFVQNEESKELLHSINIDNVVVAGDTRFDRVAEIAKKSKRNPVVEQFKGDTPLFIAGSTWPLDEDLLIELIKENRGIKFVIAPHEIGEERISELESKLESVVRYTKSSDCEGIDSKQTLLLDTIGELSSIYAYASWAYIGGGFGVGIHNTLEASIFGLPMAFGPNYHKFKEAKDMVALGACCSVRDFAELGKWFTPLRDDKEHLTKISEITKGYTSRNRGASQLILSTIFETGEATLS